MPPPMQTSTQTLPVQPLFDQGPRPTLPVAGHAGRFPVRRIYCVGRNYAAHAREMGGDPEREPPFFFQKPADAVVADGADVPYPPRTSDLQHEVELVVALGRGGRNVPVDQAGALVFAQAVGIDLTRRDLQAAARKAGKPWDTAKAFDHSAPVGLLHPTGSAGPLTRGTIRLAVNDELRQEADLADMTWSVTEVIAELSTLFELAPGDLIFTGTPSGVGPLFPGDRIDAGIAGLGTLVTRIGPPIR
ncbi:fumarylacetoacetate hydrolase family protein [Rhodocista pekingensis]